MEKLGRVESAQRVGTSAKANKQLKFWKKHAESDKEVLAFMSKMEKSGLVQGFGCVLVVEDGTFKVRALSENAPQMLLGKPASMARPLQLLAERISRSIGRFNRGRAQFQRGSAAAVREQAAALDPEGAAALAAAEEARESLAQDGAVLGDGEREPPTGCSPVGAAQGRAGPARPGAEVPGGMEARSQFLIYRRNSAPTCGVPRVSSHRRGSGFGVGDDARLFFTPASVLALESAAASPDMALLNPVLVQAEATGIPFYAILHRHPGGGVLIDLEPIQPSDPVINGAGALQTHKLAAKAVARLQAIPPGNPKLLYKAVAEEIRALTGYDRVMVYRFHEDEHGEVVGESRANNVESYLGLHFPSSDIPKGARMLFVANRSRLIVDARANPVRVLQETGWLGLQSSVNLGMSTMRAVHGCHMQYMANMGTVGSLSLSLVMRERNGVLMVSMPDHSGGRAPVKTGFSAKGQPMEGASQAPRNDRTVSHGFSSKVAQPEDGEAHSSNSDGSAEAVLWGMVVCHSTQGPKYVSYPVRSACEFLMQVFGIQITRELETQASQQEHRLLSLQTLLCHVLMKPNPLQMLMSASPGIMDLVSCSGAAYNSGDAFQACGVSPLRSQVVDLIAWIRSSHPKSTGFTIDSLATSGYPGAASLAETVCGLAAVQLGEGQFLLWFRQQAVTEVQWGGAKEATERRKAKFKDRTPRASFATYLEIVKNQSQPWSDADIDAIHSLQLILRDALRRHSQSAADRAWDTASDEEYQKLYAATFEQLVHFIESASAPIVAVDLSGAVTGWNQKAAELTGLSFDQACGKSLVDDLLEAQSREAASTALGMALKGSETRSIRLSLLVWGENAAAPGPAEGRTVTIVANAFVSRDTHGTPQGICFLGQDVTQEEVLGDQFVRLKGDYCSIVDSHTSIIPPIFGCDEVGRCIEWNKGMEELTGWCRDEAAGRMLVREVFGAMCPLGSYDAKTRLMVALSRALAGHVTDKLPFAFLNCTRSLVDVMLSVHPRYASDGLTICGVFCFAHVSGLEVRESVRRRQAMRKLAAERTEQLTYTRQEVVAPLNGLRWSLEELSRSLGEGKSSSKSKQMAWLKTSSSLLSQIDASLENVNLEMLEQGHFNLKSAAFTMESVLSAVVAQATAAANPRDCRVTSEIAGSLRSLPLMGDSERLQQVLAGLAVTAARFTPQAGLVKIEVSQRGAWSKHWQGGDTVEIEIRISQTGTGVPGPLISEMMDDTRSNKSQEGHALRWAYLILRCMDGGDVIYNRKEGRPSFDIHLKLPLASGHRRLGASLVL